MSEPPRVSVSIICYNQAQYIEACLESVLAQRTAFPFEIVVGDDASTDGTQDCIRRIHQIYPDVIHPIFHSTNIGATTNHSEVIAACRGEYIAHVDGDDRMLPGKQVEFLDTHPECVMVVHKVNVIGRNSRKTGTTIPAERHPAVTDINYLVGNYQFFVASSKMYRRSANRFPARIVPTVDLLLHVEHATLGKIGYLDEILGEYRKVSDSMSDVNSPQFPLSVKGSLDALERGRELGVPGEVVTRGMSKFTTGLSLLYLEKGDLNLFRKYLRESHPPGATFLGMEHRVIYFLSNMPNVALAIYRLRKSWRALKSSARRLARLTGA
jgi:glycosyltransferase involved in cell wall biosynthesis